MAKAAIATLRNTALALAFDGFMLTLAIVIFVKAH